MEHSTNNFLDLPVLFFAETKKKLCTENYIKKHGFKNVFYVNVPTINKKFNLETAWDFIGLHDPELENNFKNDFLSQKNSIYHLMILKYVIQNNIDIAIILEEDLEFHCDWFNLVHVFFENTPSDYDILYLGSVNVLEKENKPTNLILDIPVKGNHAYVITLEGAKKLFHILISQPIHKFDDVIYKEMSTNEENRLIPFKWYVWNENIFQNKNHPKNQIGLVFKK